MITDDPHCPFFYRLIKSKVNKIQLKEHARKRLEMEMENGNIDYDQFSGEYFFDPDWEAECKKRLEFLDL